MAHDRECEDGPERGRRDRRDEPDQERHPDGVADARDRVPVCPVVEREPLPHVVEAPGGRVEREEDHHGDRQHQVAEREDRVAREQIPSDPAHGYPVSLSVPTARA